jgi:hypothetical protein
MFLRTTASLRVAMRAISVVAVGVVAFSMQGCKGAETPSATPAGEAWRTKVAIGIRASAEGTATYPRFEVTQVPARLVFRTESKKPIQLSGELWNATKMMSRMFTVKTDQPGENVVDLTNVGTGTYEIRAFASETFFADLQVR